MDTDRDVRIKLEALECRHYTGTHREVCKAGVTYRDLVGGPDLGWALKIPCHGVIFDHAKDVQRVPCEHKSTWTPEEAAANVDAMDAAMERHMSAHRVAHDDAKANGLKRGHGGLGTVKCPVCDDGTIRYSVASYNGHMHAACDTDGCVRWME